jgi:hypothetical protein
VGVHDQRTQPGLHHRCHDRTGPVGRHLLHPRAAALPGRGGRAGARRCPRDRRGPGS